LKPLKTKRLKPKNFLNYFFASPVAGYDYKRVKLPAVERWNKTVLTVSAMIRLRRLIQRRSCPMAP